VLIRSPQPADEEAWRAFWRGYNFFYGANVPDAVTDMLWRRIVSHADAVFARLAVDDDEGAVAARRLYDSYASADGFIRYTLVFGSAVR
jgi:hypothetical protein